MNKHLFFWLLIALIQLSLNVTAQEINPVTTHNLIHTALTETSAYMTSPGQEISNIMQGVLHNTLDLNSVMHNVNINNLTHEINLDINGKLTPIFNNTYLTPAESIALSQILSTNHQSLVLDNLGKAIGGSFDVSLLANNVLNLVLPKDVTLVDNFNNLTINGNLVNYGDIVFTGNGTLTSANLLNENTGLISANNNLSLNIHNDLINEGGIYGGANLNLNTGYVFNSGTIEAGLGNVNITSVNNLDIMSTVSSNIMANDGNITLSLTGLNTGNNGINLVYGNYLSENLNLNAGPSSVQGIINNVSGQININANTAHLAVASADMKLGNDLVNGDPTYVNTSGDITLTGAVTSSGANLAIIANGNINIPSSGTVTINTQGTSANGGNLLMIAGLGTNIISSGNTNTTSLPPGTATVSSITVNLGATSNNTGGNIDLVTNNSLATNNPVIETAGNGTNSNGGNVTLIAIANGSTGGSVLTSNGTNVYNIATGGTGTGSNGNVTLIAGATTGTAINLGSITTTGGSGTGGNVSIYAANPNTLTLTIDPTGTPTGTITANTASSTGGNIILNGNITAGSDTGVNTIILSDSGAGIISNSTGSGSTPPFVLTAGNVNLSSQTGSIGTIGTSSQGPAGLSQATVISVDTTYLTVNTTGASAYVVAINPIVNLEPSTVNGNYVFAINNTNISTINILGNITTGSDNNANIILLSAYFTSGRGMLNINSSSSATVLTSGYVDFYTNGGNIGSAGSPLYINASNIGLVTGMNSVYTGLDQFTNTALTTGNVYISDSASSVSLDAPNVQLSGHIDAIIGTNANFNLTMTNSTSGSINIGAAIGGYVNGTYPTSYTQLAPFNTLNFTTSGSGAITASPGLNIGIVANNVNFTTINGDIGSNATGIIVASPNVTVNDTTGNAYINDYITTGAAGLGDSSISGTLQFATQPVNSEQVNINSGVTVLANKINFNDISELNNNGSISCQNLTVTAGSSSGTPVLTFAGTGSYLAPVSVTIGASTGINQNLNLGNLFTSSQPINTNSLNIFASGTITTSAITISVQPASNGDAGLLFIQAPALTDPNNLTFVANGTTPISTYNLTLNIGDTVGNTNTITFGTAAGQFQVQANDNNLSIATGSTVNIDTNISAAAVSILNDKNTNTITMSPGTTITGPNVVGLSTSTNAGNFVISNLISNSAIFITTAGGNITINNGSTITAGDGILEINNSSTSSGSIAIGANATLSGYTPSFVPVNNNEVIIVNGTIPSSGTNTTNPTNVITNLTNAANVYYGTNGITANSPNNTINANTYNVLFAGGSSSTPITLGGGVTINSSPVNSVINITSLDLTNSTATSAITTLQSQGKIGGTLIVNGSGVATGGNIILNNTDNLTNITAENIPSNVTVTFSGLTSANAVDINLSSSSTAAQVVINGTEQFTSIGGGSAGVINITTTNTSQTQPLFLLGATGKLTSDGSLMVNSAGNSAIAGSVTAVSSINFTATSGSNGSISISNNVTASGVSGLINLTADGSGTITQTAGLLTAPTVNLASVTGNIGSNTNNILLSTQSLTISNQASAFIANNGNLNLNSLSLANTFSLSNTGNLTVIGNITVPNLILYTNNGGALTVNAQVGIATGTDIFNASGYLTTGSNGVIIANSLSLVSSTGEIGFGVGGAQPLTTQANNIVFSAPLSVGISNTSSNLNFGTSATQGNFYVYQTGNITASGTITAPVLGLYSFTGTTGIGSSTSLIQVNSADIGLQSYGTGSSVYVNDLYTNNTILQASQASLQAGSTGLGGVFKFNTAGPLSIYAQIDHGGNVTAGQVSAQIIAIQAFDANNGYGIYNEANMNSNDFIFLTASQSAYIAQAATNAIMNAPNIALVTGGGAIGAGSQLLINSGLVAASTSSANGFVNIYDEAANSGIFGGQSGASFTFNTNGNLTVFGSIGTGAGTTVANSNINLTANGILKVGNTTGIDLTTNNGAIVLQNNNTLAGAINFAANDLILSKSTSTSSGYVTFNIGSFSQTNTTNPNPANITVQTAGSGNVYFGNNGIQAKASGNILFADGQNIAFNTGSLPSTAIILGGNDKITADPPIVISLVNPGNFSNTNNITNSSNTNLTSSINNSNVINLDQFTNYQSLSNLTGNNLNRTDLNNMVNKHSLNSLANDNLDLANDNDSLDNTAFILPISYTAYSNDYRSSSKVSSPINNLKLVKENLDQHSLIIYPGSSLIYSSHELTIYPQGKLQTTITLKKGSLVLILTDKNNLAIYNLHDQNKDSVIVNATNHKFKLNPGQQVTLSTFKNINDFTVVNLARKIGYRNIKAINYKNASIFVTDFSIPSTIMAIKPLKAMFKNNDKLMRNLSQQLLKTSSVIMQSTSNKGAYTLMQSPKLTAYR